MVKTRLITALLLIMALWAMLYLLPPLVATTAALALVALSAREWGRLMGRAAAFNRDYALWVSIAGALLLLLIYQPGGNTVRILLFGSATAFWLLLAPLWLARGYRLAQAPSSLLLGGLILLSTWLAFVDLLARGPTVVLLYMAVIWIADSAAFFVGRAIGRRKLAPSISPNKTWEGALGAVVGVLLYALAVNAWSDVSLSLPLAVLMAVLGILGDLFESSLKRQAGVKDSGDLLPGHGGALDRIDALTAALPVASLALALNLI